MKNIKTLIWISLLLSSCSLGKQEFKPIVLYSAWKHHDNARLYEASEVEKLKQWWYNIEDETLNSLINLTLADSPDRNIAKARIDEARGIRKTNKSTLLPQIGASVSGGRQDTGTNFGSQPDYFSDARFDASYEIDLWGKNYNNLQSSDLALKSLQQNYDAISLSLISEVLRTYTEYREFEKQENIAKRNLKIQKKTLNLVKIRYDIGESSKLDVDRSSNLVNTTKASIPEFERLKNNKKLELTVLTGVMPTSIDSIIENSSKIPEFTSTPILLSPASVIASRPDVKAASFNLSSKTKLAESVTATLFPSLNISGFYGLADSSIISSENIWNIAIGTAVNLIDFGRIEGRVDASRAREYKAFEEYRKVILVAVTDVEMALNDYTKIEEKKTSLQKAYFNALSAYETSNRLYKEGEISFIDVLDSERILNSSNSSYVTAKAEHTKSIIRLYKSLGVY